MIMPSASMGASQQGESSQMQTQNGNSENKTAVDNKVAAENDSDSNGKTAAKGETGDSKAEESKTVEHKDSQPPAKQDASNASSARNVDSTQKQNNAVEGAKQDAAKDADERAKKEESAKKLRQQKRELGNTRAAADSTPLPKECKDAGITELAKCYVAEYFYTIKRKKKVAIKKSITINDIGESHTITPVFRRVKKINNKGIPTIDEKTDASSSVKGLIESFSLERLSTVSTALESNVENNDFVKVNPTSGEIKIHANKWLNNGSYYVFVKVKYKDNSTLTRSQWCTNSCDSSYNKYSRFSIQIRYKNPTNDVLSLKVYNHQDSKDRAEVKDNGIAATVESDDKGNFSPITPIFIDTTSSKRPNLIYHRMICHKEDSSDYYLNSINGLTLSASASSTGQTTQKQWKHVPGVRPDDNKLSESSGNLYESDDIIERSQSWITGTPKEAGTFECKVLALKDIGVSAKDKHHSHTFVEVFDEAINDKTKKLKQNLFDTNVKVEDIFSAYVPEKQSPEDPTPNPYGIFMDTYDRKKVWDVKTIKIVVESNKQDQPIVGENDLKLNVYPFKNGDGSLPAPLSSSNNKISAMLGMELKPYIEATSAEDSANKITLRVLCKGEQKNAAGGGASAGGIGSSGSSGDTSGTGSTDGNSSTGSQPAQSSGSSQTAEATWSSNLAELGLSADTAQTRCNEAGDGKCTADNVASQAAMSVSIKPTDVGDYQCVVYALKQDVLDKFNTEVAKTGVTPQKISAAFKSANLKANKDYAQLAINIHVPKKFELPDTGGQNWNLQLGAVAAVMVSVLAAGFVISQSEACRKLLYERRRC
ncbi:LPXTG-motif protein cell wall anchor domain protein [Gardnerella vaginalis]|uniref:LPXTG-motif protein cell wall anchor domain protein n=2 Tax=Gardnerella vaginalis TaxID=2702 RepID=A0A133NPQ3_GARVA|nr:LPXTG-motif protein cell wall anchor domain protein [Gardnerella vaginalis]